MIIAFVVVPRGDIIEFDLSGLTDSSKFDIYTNGSLLSTGKSRVGNILTVNTGQVAAQIVRLFYKNTDTPGLGWIINIIDS